MKKGLLIGAGFSYDLGMPLAKELTEILLELFAECNISRLAAILRAKEPFGKERPINVEALKTGLKMVQSALTLKEANYESVIAKLQKMEGIGKPNQSDRDSYRYLFHFCYSLIYNILCIYQQVSYQTIYINNNKWFLEFSSLLADNETWTFSLNHDLYIECLAIDLKIPITYGGTGNLVFPVNNLEPHRQIAFTTQQRSQLSDVNQGYLKGVPGINLVKLHGGLSEFLYRNGELLINLETNQPTSKKFIDDFLLTREMAHYIGGQKIRGEQTIFVTNSEGEADILETSMLTGGAKYSKTLNPKKGEEKLQLFDSILQEINELTVIGYGFGDKHVNARIINAMSLNPKLQVRIVDPNGERIPECIEQFDYDDRIKRAYCGVAEWMHYNKHNTWDSAQSNALKEIDRTAIKVMVMSLMKIY